MPSTEPPTDAPAPAESPAATASAVQAFDWDAWISGRARPHEVVHVHPGHDELEAALTAKNAEIEDLLRQHELAESVDADNRGINDPSPAALEVLSERASTQYRELKAQYDALAMPFHVVQLDQEQIIAAHKLAVAEGADAADRETLGLYVIAAAITSPPTTAANLAALKARDRSGAQMVTDITTAVGRLLEVSAPFSPPSTPGPS